MEYYCFERIVETLKRIKLARDVWKRFEKYVSGDLEWETFSWVKRNMKLILIFNKSGGYRSDSFRMSPTILWPYWLIDLVLCALNILADRKAIEYVPFSYNPQVITKYHYDYSYIFLKLLCFRFKTVICHLLNIKLYALLVTSIKHYWNIINVRGY